MVAVQRVLALVPVHTISAGLDSSWSKHAPVDDLFHAQVWIVQVVSQLVEQGLDEVVQLYAQLSYEGVVLAGGRGDGGEASYDAGGGAFL